MTERRRPLLVYADGPDSPRISPTDVAARLGLDRPTVLLGWTPQGQPWLDDPSLEGWTVMAGYALAAAVADGRLTYLPVRLSAVPSLLGEWAPDVAVVAGVRRGGELAFASTVGYGPAAARAAAAVVVEVDDAAPDLGAPLIPGRIAAVVDRPPSDDAPVAPRRPDDVELAIGRHVASLLPERPTLQLGPGGIAEAIVAGLDRPVSIWSGLLTESTAELLGRGLLAGEATAAYAWGRDAVAALAAEGRLRLLPVDETHDLSRLSAIPRLVACNTALQVGLDGAVDVERIHGRLVAGIGGHADFCAGASRSPGGLSVIAFRSVDRRGRSTIVAQPEVVSTPRCDVDVVVTEHGAADLRGADDTERARRIIAVAAPEHREALDAARGARAQRPSQ